jgi:hypothetical protein
MSAANILNSCADIQTKMDDLIVELKTIRSISHSDTITIKENIKRLTEQINTIDSITSTFLPNIYIDNITPDILSIIAKHLSLTDILSLSQTCKHVRRNLNEIMKEVHRHLGVKDLEFRLRRGYITDKTVDMNIKALKPFLPLANYKLTTKKYQQAAENDFLRRDITRVLIHKDFITSHLYTLPNVTHVTIARGELYDRYMAHLPKLQLKEQIADRIITFADHGKLFIDTPCISLFPNAVNVTLQQTYVRSLQFMAKLEELTLKNSLVGSFSSNIPSCSEEDVKRSIRVHNPPDRHIRIVNADKNWYLQSLKHLRIIITLNIPICIDMRIFPLLVSLYIDTKYAIDIHNIESCEKLRSVYIDGDIDGPSLKNIFNVDSVTLRGPIDDSIFDNINQIRCKNLGIALRGNISVSTLTKLADLNKLHIRALGLTQNDQPVDIENRSVDSINDMYQHGCGWKCLTVENYSRGMVDLYFTRSLMMLNVRYLKLDNILFTQNISTYTPNLVGLSIRFHCDSVKLDIPPNVKYLEIKNSGCIKAFTGTENLECLCVRDREISSIMRSKTPKSKLTRELRYDFRNLQVLLINTKKIKALETFLIALSTDIMNGLIPLKYLYIGRYDETWPVIRQLTHIQNILINYPISPLPHLFSLYRNNPVGWLDARLYMFDIFDPVNNRDNISVVDHIDRRD